MLVLLKKVGIFIVLMGATIPSNSLKVYHLNMFLSPYLWCCFVLKVSFKAFKNT